MTRKQIRQIRQILQHHLFSQMIPIQVSRYSNGTLNTKSVLLRPCNYVTICALCWELKYLVIVTPKI